MSEYTLTKHNRYKDVVQWALDYLVRIAQDTGLGVNTKMMLKASNSDGLVITIEYTSPMDDVGCFSVKLENELLFRVQFRLQTGQVDDSASFSEEGVYQGWGHVQCWHQWSRSDRNQRIESMVKMLLSIQSFELVAIS